MHMEINNALNKGSGISELLALRWDIRHPDHGREFRVNQKIWRLLGVINSRTMALQAKYWEPDDSFVQSCKDLGTSLFS